MNDKLPIILANAFLAGNKLMTAGNGGSAADAMHMAEELVGRFHRSDRRPLPAICLNSDPTILTCIANDFGFENVFSRQIEAHTKKGDVFIAFSTSGNSPNIVFALEKANKLGAYTILFTGRSGGSSAAIARLVVNVDSTNTAEIQECHTKIMHKTLATIDEMECFRRKGVIKHEV